MSKTKNRARSTGSTRILDLNQNKIILVAIIIIALFIVLVSLRQ